MKEQDHIVPPNNFNRLLGGLVLIESINRESHDPLSFLRAGALLPDLFSRRAFVLRGHAIVFVGPMAEVYELAAFGAERAVRIVGPLDGLVTGRTALHDLKRKTKRQKERRKCVAFASNVSPPSLTSFKSDRRRLRQMFEQYLAINELD